MHAINVSTLNHVANVVRLGKRIKLHVSVDDVNCGLYCGQHGITHGRHITQPVQNVHDTVEIVLCSQMTRTIIVHYLSATQLQIGGVHLAPKYFVECVGAGQNNRMAFNLHGALSQTNQVCANANGTARDQRHGENVLVSARRLTSNHAAAL